MSWHRKRPAVFSVFIRAVSQLRWPHKGREEWFSLGENQERRRGFGLHQLRNRSERSSALLTRSDGE
jgi:hypothetical protein